MKWVRRFILNTLDRILGVRFRRNKNTGITRADYTTLAQILEPGDILLTRTNWNPTNLFIPGFWKHAAMYTAFDETTEALGHGLVETPLMTILMRSDYVVMVRPRYSDAVDRAAAAQVMQTLVGLDYDLMFEQGNDSFYCSEAVAYSYQQAMGGRFEFITRDIMGVKTILPNDFHAATEHFDVIYDSRGI